MIMSLFIDNGFMEYWLALKWLFWRDYKDGKVPGPWLSQRSLSVLSSLAMHATIWFEEKTTWLSPWILRNCTFSWGLGGCMLVMWVDDEDLVSEGSIMLQNRFLFFCVMRFHLLEEEKQFLFGLWKVVVGDAIGLAKCPSLGRLIGVADQQGWKHNKRVFVSGEFWWGHIHIQDFGQAWCYLACIYDPCCTDTVTLKWTRHADMW